VEPGRCYIYMEKVRVATLERLERGNVYRESRDCRENIEGNIVARIMLEKVTGNTGIVVKGKKECV